MARSGQWTALAGVRGGRSDNPQRGAARVQTVHVRPGIPMAAGAGGGCAAGTGNAVPRTARDAQAQALRAAAGGPCAGASPRRRRGGGSPAAGLPVDALKCADGGKGGGDAAVRLHQPVIASNSRQDGRRGGSPAARLPYYCNCTVPRAVPPGGVRPRPVKPLF